MLATLKELPNLIACLVLLTAIILTLDLATGLIGYSKGLEI